MGEKYRLLMSLGESDSDWTLKIVIKEIKKLQLQL
jgi:hypothetical protein